jgi:hypothetical protein
MMCRWLAGVALFALAGCDRPAAAPVDEHQEHYFIAALHQFGPFVSAEACTKIRGEIERAYPQTYNGVGMAVSSCWRGR